MISRGRDPLVGITAHEATITLRIVARGRDEAACLAKIAPTEATIRECLGDLVYGVEEDEIEDAALAAVAAGSATLATVEIATQGQVAAMLAQAQARRTPSVLRGGIVLPAIEGAVAGRPRGMGAQPVPCDSRAGRRSGPVGLRHGDRGDPARRPERSASGHTQARRCGHTAALPGCQDRDRPGAEERRLTSSRPPRHEPIRAVASAGEPL